MQIDWSQTFWTLLNHCFSYLTQSFSYISNSCISELTFVTNSYYAQCSLWLSYAGTKIKSKIAFNIFKCYKQSNSRDKKKQTKNILSRSRKFSRSKWGFIFNNLSWKKQNSIAQHEFWHMSNQTHVMLLHFLMASEHWVD